MEHLKKEDYEEPACIFCTDRYTGQEGDPLGRIPIDRIIHKLEEYLGRRDHAGAQRHLDYWLVEAGALHDRQGELSLRNERMGLFRKLGNKEQALQEAEKALDILKNPEIESSSAGATTLLNVATVYSAFEREALALALYRQAECLYDKLLDRKDSRKAGLFNNMALVLCKTGAYKEAREKYDRALKLLDNQETDCPERAIILLNLCDLIAAEKGLEDGEAELDAFLDEAEKQITDENIQKNGYYAFVCEKCAPVFGYYGRFLTEKQLKEEAERIYAGACAITGIF